MQTLPGGEMMLSDDAKALVALTTRLNDSSRPSLSPTRWHRLSAVLQDAGLRPADVFDSRRDVTELPGLPIEIVEAVQRLLEDAAATTVAAAELRDMGIWTLTYVDPMYPATLTERLGRLAPPVLFGVGPAGLLDRPGVGIVGSRNVTEDGARVAEEVARTAVQHGRSVVSGGARGVDQLAMNAAFLAGGAVVGVLADSLTARIRKSDILSALDGESICLVTQQAPSSGFSPGAAMSRNKLIYAFSDATVVIAVDHESGGSWAGAVEALKAHNGTVAVWRGQGEGPGNESLEGLGATPIRETANLIELLDMARTAQPEQLALGEV